MTKLATRYFKSAAEKGDVYSQHAMGGISMNDGDVDDAIKWYSLASAQGDSYCSYNLYLIFKKIGRGNTSELYFQKAVEQDHPLAIQQQAIRYILGKHGVGFIPVGIKM